MNRTQVSNAIECWPKEKLIDYVSNLQSVMYSSCKVSLDLCETCDLDPKKHARRCAEVCPNHTLRENIKKVKGYVDNPVGVITDAGLDR